jgi:hypothetical protein
VQLSTWLVAKCRQAYNYPHATSGPICLTPRSNTRWERDTWVHRTQPGVYCHQWTWSNFLRLGNPISQRSMRDLKPHVDSTSNGWDSGRLVHLLLRLFLYSETNVFARVAHATLRASRSTLFAKMASSSSHSGNSIYTSTIRGCEILQLLNSYSQEVQSPRLSERRQAV